MCIFESLDQGSLDQVREPTARWIDFYNRRRHHADQFSKTRILQFRLVTIRVG